MLNDTLVLAYIQEEITQVDSQEGQFQNLVKLLVRKFEIYKICQFESQLSYSRLDSKRLIHLIELDYFDQHKKALIHACHTADQFDSICF